MDINGQHKRINTTLAGVILNFYKKKPLINCDLGEGLDAIDAAVMPYLNQASIACGGHAGNESTMRLTLALAKQHQVACGAHPSYPDRKNFGRSSLVISSEDLTQSLKQQIQQLTQAANQQNIQLKYIKPHGALYNDCCEPRILKVLLAVASFFNLPLMLSASQNTVASKAMNTSNEDITKNTSIAAQCHYAGVKFIPEAFADRGYNKNGSLVKRGMPGALLDTQQSIVQVNNLIHQQGLKATCGYWLNIQCQSLCVHSDTPNAINTVKALAELLVK